ncbi:unnamed protein product [Durusdinium trenchii]|uniref:Uncharacterized protein n=1 Tax=Durusdinium trenchii TaxID=1381693 RepID=A0ABP0K165_9DINO
MHSDDLQDKARCVHLMREGTFGKTRGSQSPRDEKALPKLTASISGAGGQERKAKTPKASSVTVEKAVHGPSIERGEDLLSEEESDFSDEEEVQIFKANRASSHRHGRKTYSMQAALEISALPVLPLNHAHAQRFREMFSIHTFGEAFVYEL